MTTKLLLNIFMDCEATQPAICDSALGERAALGFAEVLDAYGLSGTFHVLVTDLESSSEVYRGLEARGHEVGLHIHPVMDGLGEYLGIYSGEVQYELIDTLSERFAQSMGHRPTTWCPGYFSTNDATYAAAYRAGMSCGCTSMPGRILPECASVHAGAPLDPHYAHEYSRLLPGQMDYVELPVTVDPDSRMWGGKQPQDLRVELVDAKNHWYTINKSIERQLSQQSPTLYLRGMTHNVFDYSDPNDFRTQTLKGVIERAQRAAEMHGAELQGKTAEQIAIEYRSLVSQNTEPKFELDRSGH